MSECLLLKKAIIRSLNYNWFELNQIKIGLGIYII